MQKRFISLIDIIPKPLQHFPLIQTLIHSIFTMQLQCVLADKKAIEEENKQLPLKVIKEFSCFEDFVEKKEENKSRIQQLAKEYHDACEFEKKLLGLFQEFKIMEGFLEGAPQSVLQIVIMLREYEDVDWFTYFTITTSFFCFSKTTAEIFLIHPSKVNHNN